MSLFQKKDNLTPAEYIVKYSLIYLNMKRVKDDALEKIMSNDENQSAMRSFCEPAGNFLFVIQQGNDGISIMQAPPAPATIKKKALICLKAREELSDEDIQNEIKFPTGIENEVVFIEVNKPVLENLYASCQEVFLPLLSNPLNQMGWSDLVCKDLMEKFHSFLAYTYVTIGQIKGRTMLPLPPSDVTSSEKTSSKDKAAILETAISHWTKQIKHELKKDPEDALKGNNHPDPLTEIEFWRNKSENLNSICEQLTSEKIKKVLKFLEQNKSTQTSSFSKLQKEVQIARAEANENYKYLSTLEDLFCDLVDTSKELHEVADLFTPIMHTILLIWTYSSNYNTPARLLVLIREICNAIIKQCRNAVDGEKVFADIKNDVPGEAHSKLVLACDVCSKFKDVYYDYKNKSKNQWKITPSALFVRLDAFSERCQDIMQITGTIQQFNKLQKIEIGNTKGMTLSETIKHIFNEFQSTIEQFCLVQYDIMNIEKLEFEDDFFKFKQRIKELERRLASVLTNSFDDCDTIIGKFKLLESFEGLLTRPIIQDELEKKQINLLELYKADLKIVNQIFQEGKALVERVDADAPISLNMPPIAGAINWTTGLYERVQEPFLRLQSLPQSLQDREEYKDVKKIFESLRKNLNEFEQVKIAEWEKGVEENTEDQLNQFLLVREETPLAEEGFVRVNFNPILVRYLREVKYLQLLDIDVPERAQKLFDKVEIYRSQTGRLDIIVEKYNNIIATLLPVEKPLMMDRINKINKTLQPGIDKLKWNSDNIDPFITQAMQITETVDELVKKMKENVRKMIEMMATWSSSPLYQRKQRTQAPEDVESIHNASVNVRLEQIEKEGKDIMKLMKDTIDNIKPDKKSSMWLAYVDYVNGLVIEGITNAIDSSMTDLALQISVPYNKQHGLAPIFLINVCLSENQIQFDPSITCNENGNGIRDIINNITRHFISLSIKMPSRMDAPQGAAGDYLVEIKDQFQLFGAMQAITNNLNQIEVESGKFLDQYSDISFLWEEELENYFQNFLKSGPDLRETFIKQLKADETLEEEKIEVEIESFDAMATKIMNSVQTQMPALEIFDEKITHYHEVKNRIAQVGLKPQTDIGWIRVNSTPLIKELQLIIERWIEKFTSFLLENTNQQLQNTMNFIDEVKTGIKELPKALNSDRDKKLLTKVMTHLRDVSQIKDKTLESFPSLRNTIQLLKKHNVDVNAGQKADLLVILENSRTDLVDTADKALGPIKEQILPLQGKESDNVKKRVREFQLKVLEFRQDFTNKLPYHVTDTNEETIDKAYETISEYYDKTCEMEAEAKELQHLESLFELQRTNQKELKDCKNELIQLKKMWDLIGLIDYQFDAWKKTLWDQIDTDNLAALLKDIKTKQTAPNLAQNKEIKGYKAFQALNERVKQMDLIGPMVSQLHSDNMQERHWKKLMHICQKNVDFQSPKFCLNDIIKLELFKFGDDVNELVEGAQKEAKIEIKLANIEQVWESNNFDFKEYKDTKIINLGLLDEIVEVVDVHSMDIMTMNADKNSEVFKTQLLKWQKTLKTVDAVIQLWVKVQKNWMRLEPIFLASEDIRAQLPEDTKRFEKVDIDWKALMADAAEDCGVVAATNAEGREGLLQEFQADIDICEKALTDYLEQKKKVFPRFYFVSNQALLEILSNGNNPEKVNEFVTDCFDGMKMMRFKEVGQRPWKISDGMFSKEMEFVPFKTDFVIGGAVENYLCELEKKMQDTLKEVAVAAKETTDEWEMEKPRELWLDGYCAQLSLLATQIVWTEATARAFDDLESGSEMAMKEHLEKIKGQIQKLIARVRQDLDGETRLKVITIITIDVHSRDVIKDFVDQKIQDSSSFAWARQLKFGMKKSDKKNAKDEVALCFAYIADWSTQYNYEYVGNTGRLVITPLTDRCYITLTQALNLSMGGAPAGPAGTGKTETTKDLGRALGLQVVVFNCSEQMTYQSMAQIFMGLSQAGSWGCFDEFNRIELEVLSVVSSQVKTCLDAIKKLKANPNNVMFQFEDENIPMKLTSGYFITMNPGYAGRTELPENLKALFRSCAMVVPDIILICENMLMAEGFENARDLSKKFMTLYQLAKSLLSDQKHYDWGLRAVKSVLRQAGQLKRNSPEDPEFTILMRALRDFNLPKIVVQDQKIFLDLIVALFPKVHADPATRPDLYEAAENAAIKAGLQPEKVFVQKCVDLADILDVRHSMFIIGNPGSGKTQIWRTMSEAYTLFGQEAIYEVIDPKAVSSNELYGFINTKTKEWKDGVLSVIMRDMNKSQNRFKTTHKHKWVVLDGDVEPTWIESLNTVMDDNKVLTLVSQERIPMTKEMKLVLEVSNLKHATPATVSRGGVLFINDIDVGWRPYIDTWMTYYKSEDRIKEDEKLTAHQSFQFFLNQYCNENFMDDYHHREKIAPVCDMGNFQTLTTIIDYQYKQLWEVKEKQEYMKRLKDEEDYLEKYKLIYEGIFAFAYMWAFGAPLSEDKISFSGSLRSTCKVKFPEGGQTFDYFFNPLTIAFEPWAEEVQKFNPDTFDGIFSNLVVPTTETSRQRYILDIHKSALKGVLYIGTAGTGKTTIIKNYIESLNIEKTINAAINFNSYTDSKTLQAVIFSNVDRRTGKYYGPMGGKNLFFFIDDLNMPAVDKFDSQPPICLLRQIIDFGIIFNREHLEEQYKLLDIMFAGCMNPKSGSYFVDLRMARHLTQIGLGVPEKEILQTIYAQVLSSHFSTFEAKAQDLAPKLVNATVAVFMSMALSPQFMPTAMKFHYQFNMRDVGKIVQNLMLAQSNVYKGNLPGLARMWAHECHRVWYDRLLFDEDRNAYMNFMKNGLKELNEFKEEVVFAEPLLYTSFVAICGGHEPAYKPVEDYESLKNVLEDKLAEYNENVQSMELVLFNQAMEHITRISRIIFQPSGHALLVGVGGSGKQSLSKLTAYIHSYEIFRIVVASNYTVNDLKTDIQTLFMRTGVQGFETLFLLTDSQIVDNKFLVFINDVLSSGYVPELFAKDELDGIYGKIRSEAKSLGYQDTPEQLQEFFVNKVKKALHIGLCFSPVGEAFRVRARMFPGLINGTTIDWFTSWPRDALVDVANRFLSKLDFGMENEETPIMDMISNHMANVHLSIEAANIEFKERERRFNYTTPTSFLELINFYSMLLAKKQGSIVQQIERLEKGLYTMDNTTKQVDLLKEQLVIKMEQVEVEKKNTDILIEEVSREAEIADREQAEATKQEEATNIVAQAAKVKMDAANDALTAAVPKMEAAKKAVDCLDVKAIQEFKGYGTPPGGTDDVAAAVQILLGEKSEKKRVWGNQQKMMNPPPAFIQTLKDFCKEDIKDWQKVEVNKLRQQPHFTYETMKSKSSAAANLAAWVLNVMDYNEIYVNVKPLQEEAESAEANLKQKNEELKVVQDKVAALVAKVDALKAQLAEAEAKKQAVVDEAEDLTSRLNLANRLVNGLGDEYVRWTANVQTSKNDKITMIGNALVSAAFVSYIGPFSSNFRNNLWRNIWIPDIEALKIPYTDGVDPLYVLSSAAEQAVWATQGLPADRVSIENAAVVVSTSRYPLLIDPQLQGIKWIKGREGPEMVIITLTASRWQKKVELAVSNGQCLMIEAVGEEIDALLDPLLSRQFIKKGKNLFVKLGGEEVEKSPDFSMYLQTKLINPHYKPETAAQCTIVNFIVTESGLEDQLLAMVVRQEKPELEQTKEQLTTQQQQYIIELDKLEADLLHKLVSADSETILQNIELIEQLENTKLKSSEIQEAQIVAKKTEQDINTSRETYRRVAAEGALLYFLLIQLWIVEHMYQYSLESFTQFFFKAIEKTPAFEDDETRVLELRQMIRIVIYTWVSRGLFERHKTIFLAQITFRLMHKGILNVEYTQQEMSFLINCPISTLVGNPLKKWLPDQAWFAVQKLIELEGFDQFAQHLSKDAPARFEVWYNELAPESKTLPLEWRSLDSKPFQKMLVVRCLRPDRLTTALLEFIKAVLPKGNEFVDCDSQFSSVQVLEQAYADSSPQTPIFFILSPGSNPVKDVETLLLKEKMDINKHFHTVALGQGQDVVANMKLETAHKEGHWVMLQNVHLMPRYLIAMEKKLADFAAEGSDPNFRLFLSADPNNSIPIYLLEKSIKLTNEPPAGVKANLLRAFTFFTRDQFEELEGRIKTVLFGLCYFHTVMLERRKFGPKGFNSQYPFNIGDLRDSAAVLKNYLEMNAAGGTKVPWDDLKYIFGEIMYGGHIVDDRDRIFCNAFLDNLMNEKLLDEANMFPYTDSTPVQFKCPPATTYDKYLEHIETELPPESPLAFGLHPNAEIDFRTQQSNQLFQMLVELTPKDGGSSEGGGDTVQSKVAEFMGRVSDEAQLDSNKINVEDIRSKLTEVGPMQNVFIQECELINKLIEAIVKSLMDVDLANKGELTMSEALENLMEDIFMNRVPAAWAKFSFETVRSLGSWLNNIRQRLEQLNAWKDDPTKEPLVTFINRLYNPQSFLTAIKQIVSKEKSVELNKLYIETTPMKKMYWETAELPQKKAGGDGGCYTFGMQLQGARWDPNSNSIEESEPKKQFSVIPVVNCVAKVVQDTKDEKGIYSCPIYKTERRGNTYVTNAQLKTKQPARKWILAGVAIILDVEGVSDAFPYGKEPAS